MTVPDLSSKVAFVTGGGQGIGAALAEAFATAGARVVTADLTGADMVLDVRDHSAVGAAIEEVAEREGGLDVVVANAGVTGPLAPMTDVSLEDWRSTHAVNLDGAFSTLQAGARIMAAGGGGSLLAVASIMGLRPGPLSGPYSATKAALISLVRSFAIELRDVNVRANAICPGFVDTPMIRDNQERFERELGIGDLDAVVAQGQGRFVTTADIAALATYLASDKAAFMTGGAYTVDGGLSANLV